jgi:hypothetical protein
MLQFSSLYWETPLWGIPDRRLVGGTSGSAPVQGVTPVRGKCTRVHLDPGCPWECHRAFYPVSGRMWPLVGPVWANLAQIPSVGEFGPKRRQIGNGGSCSRQLTGAGGAFAQSAPRVELTKPNRAEKLSYKNTGKYRELTGNIKIVATRGLACKSPPAHEAEAINTG